MKKIIFILLLFTSFISCKPSKKYNKPTQLSQRGLEFIQKAEGCRLYAYPDGRKWTIGYGNTFYPDGTAVKKGDVISKDTAQKLFKAIAQDFAEKTSDKLTSEINLSNLEALTSYSYNRGIRQYNNSELLVIVNHDPKDSLIRSQFKKEWGSYEKYKYSLIKRRIKEAELYFKDKV
jgi:lysozyme